MGNLTRDQILAANDLPIEEVQVPRWGGTILVKAMPMANPRYMQYMLGHVGSKPPTQGEINVRRMVGAVIICALDTDGNPIFKWSDADLLRDKHWNTVTRIATKAFQLAGDDGDYGICFECNGTGLVPQDDVPEAEIIDEAEEAQDDASEPLRPAEAPQPAPESSPEVDDDDVPPVAAV